MFKDDELTRQQAEFLGVPERDYKIATPAQRNAMRARFYLAEKRRAIAAGEDADAILQALRDGFPTGAAKKPAPAAVQREEEEEEPPSRPVRKTVVAQGGQILVQTNTETLARQRKAREEAEAAAAREAEEKAAREARAEARAAEKAHAAVEEEQRLRKLRDAAFGDSDEDEDDFDDSEEDDDDDEYAPTVIEQGGVRVYPANATVPASEVDPMKRDGISVGEIVERVRPPSPDMFGDKPPRTLQDLYNRWPILEDTSYYIRIERTKPTKWQGMQTSGFVGEIRGRAVLESDLHRWLGGSEYNLTVHGPDPRGKRDENDLPVIKQLTESIKIVVPILPPNLQVIPAYPDKENHMSQPMNPFAPLAAPPMNQHDAAMHKANLDHTLKLLTISKAEEQAKDKEMEKMNTGLIQFMAESGKNQLELLREQAKDKERFLEAQLLAEREKTNKLQEKFEKVEKAIEASTGKKDFDVDGITKLLSTITPSREADTQRIAEHYRTQLDTIKAAHEDALKRLADQHNSDIRRADERLKDQELFFKRMIEEDRVKNQDTEKNLRAEIEKIRREEKEAAQQRIQDFKERHEAEIKNLEKGHERELRSIRESFDTKFTVADRLHTSAEQSLKEKLEEQKEAAERALEEAKEAGDPVRVLAKAREQAEALGYEKKDDQPKTAMERFMANAGTGLSMAMANIQDWGPKILAARQAAPALPAPQPQQQARRLRAPVQSPAVIQAQAQQAQALNAQRRARAQTWASEGGTPVRRPVNIPETPLGFQTAEEVAAQEATPVAPVAPVQPEQQVPALIAPEAVPTVPDTQPEPSPFAEKFTRHFSDQAIAGFLHQAQQAVDGAMEPKFFADMFRGQYPNEYNTMRENFTAQDLLDEVRRIPELADSALLRRDGEKWVQGLWSAMNTTQA